MKAARNGRRFVVLLLAGVALALPLVAQGVTITTTGGLLRVRAPRLTIVEGGVLERLRAGRSVEIEIDLSVLNGRGGRVVASARQNFTLSYDLWEERFAATRVGTPPRSVSHLGAREIEAWCLDNVGVSRAPLDSTFGRERTLWVRLAYRLVEDSTATPDDGSGFTLRTLIDALSRKRDAADRARVVEAGPFSLSD